MSQNDNNNTRYNQRGVSSDKPEVHNAIKNLDAGLYPGAFCKIMPDPVKDYCNIMHADGAGTKSSLAYMVWKLTGDMSVWKGIAIDAMVMNLDDLLCAGVTREQILYSSAIGRNKMIVPGDAISAIIQGTQEYIDHLNSLGLNILFAGGETADVGDTVRTIVVDGTMHVRMKKTHVIVPSINPKCVIVGFSSCGQASYEDVPNSSIGSNGLTSARHELLKAIYKAHPDTYNPHMEGDLVYCGNHTVDEMIDGMPLSLGKMILSPTRTYAPVVMSIIENIPGRRRHGFIHCSGGGQTKVLQFVPDHVAVVKETLFPTPPLFSLIQKDSETDWKEMYQTFNMGHRMEGYFDHDVVDEVIAISNSFGVTAKVVGYCTKAAPGAPKLTIMHDGKKLTY